MWLFHLHRTVNIQAFSPVFPLAESSARHLAGYSFGASRKKTSAFFCGTAFLSCGGEAANEEAQRPGQQRPFLWRREGGTVAIPVMRLEACPAFLDCFGCAWYVVVSLHRTVNIQAFSPVFPLAESAARHLAGYSFGVLRKKHQPFSMTQSLLSKALKGIREEGHAGNRKIWPNLFSSPCQKKEVTLGKRLRRFPAHACLFQSHTILPILISV